MRLGNFAKGFDILKDEGVSRVAQKVKSNYAVGTSHSRTMAQIKGANNADDAIRNLGKRNETLVDRMADDKYSKQHKRYAAEMTDNSVVSDKFRDGADFDAIKRTEMDRLKGLRKDSDIATRETALKDGSRAAKDYFVGGGFKQNSARIGAAAGIYGAAAIGGRAISGGGATYNSQGQRDIAGIPFI